MTFSFSWQPVFSCIVFDGAPSHCLWNLIQCWILLIHLTHHYLKQHLNYHCYQHTPQLDQNLGSPEHLTQTLPHCQLNHSRKFWCPLFFFSTDFLCIRNLFGPFFSLFRTFFYISSTSGVLLIVLLGLLSVSVGVEVNSLYEFSDARPLAFVLLVLSVPPVTLPLLCDLPIILTWKGLVFSQFGWNVLRTF